ncbi:glutamate receptor U1-like [Centruroides vittatus]|uniref:glutamate receptor U1-like n=1 Tax=Centruroides vittatus TaxID=120091 RepID=UPI00350FF4CA
MKFHLMDNLTLRVATFKLNGFINFQEIKNKTYFLNEGLNSKLFLLLQEKLKFNYEIIIENALGSKSSNGTWNGRVGLLTKNKADIAFPIGLNYKIHRDIETTPATDLLGIKYVIASPEEMSKILALIRTLNYEVWIAIIFTILIGTVAFYKIFAFHAKLYKRKHPSLTNIFWTLLGTFTNKGSDLLNFPGLCPRIIIIGWIFPISILVASYGASLMSFIAFPGYKNVPQTFDDLVHCLEQHHYSASTMINSAIDHFILASTSGLPFRLKKQMMQKRITALNVENIQEYERVLRENYAVIYFESSIVINADKIGFENFIMSKDALFFSIQVWGMRKGFPHKEKLSQILLYCLESGIYSKFLKDEMNKVRRMREIKKNIHYDHNHSLDVYDTAGAFAILITGYILSIFTLITEKFIFSMKNVEHKMF